MIPAPSSTLCDADTGPSPAEQTIGLCRPPHRRRVLPHLGPPLRAPHAARLGLVRVRPCLVPKIFEDFRHIEFLDTCMEH